MRTKAVLCLILSFAGVLSFAQRSERKYYSFADYSEKEARSYLDSSVSLDEVEGIWQSSDGFKYVIKKSESDTNGAETTYQVIVLENTSPVSWWKCGYLRANIQYSAVENIFSVDYYTCSLVGGELKIQKIFGILKTTALFTLNGTDVDVKLLKLYPKIGENGNVTNQEDTGAADWTGTGFAIAPNGYIATNHHVINGAKTIRINGVNGNFNVSYNADIVVSDELNDLAILKIKDSRFKGFGKIPYGSKLKTADAGENIFVLGYPMTSSMGNEIKVTNGIISSRTGFKGNVASYQISAPVQPGNSGGPLFDNGGNLIGVVNSKHTVAENAGYAIKLNYLNNLLDLLPERIVLPVSGSVISQSLPDKVKTIGKFVFLINASSKSARKHENTTPQGKLKPGTPPETVDPEVSPEKLYASADYKYTKEDYAGAYRDVVQSLQKSPEAKAYFLKGKIDLFHNLDFKEAIASFSECIALSYMTDKSKMMRGHSYYCDKDFVSAIEDYSYCIQQDRRNTDVLFWRGRSKNKTGDLAGAIADFDAILNYAGLVEAQTVELCDVYYEKANCMYARGMYDAALPVINQALESDKTKDYIWAKRGEIHYSLNLYTECVADMNNAVIIDENQPAPYYFRGLAKKMSGDPRGAYLDLNKALGLGESAAADQLRDVDISGIDVDGGIYDPLIVKNPKVKRFYNDFLKVSAVEVAADRTVVYFEYSNRSGKDFNISVDPAMCVRDSRSGKQYPLLMIKNVPLQPKQEVIKNKENLSYYCVFPALSERTKMIDVIEYPSSSKNIYGIQLR